MIDLAHLVEDRRIIVCCGSGGVGKTTSAAAFALEGARRGRRTCVVTIDPARRLADALGLGSLTNSPGRVEGRWPGELWALMLDTKSTFDALITRYAAGADQAEGILDNRLYRSLSASLSGTQEYMAMEKLHELNEEGGFDLIVVDTPPTRSALDFLSAPRRLTRLLDNRVFRAVVMPTRTYLRVVSVASQALLRPASKIVGSEMVSDVVAFFQAFAGMEEGVRNRANRVQELLSDPLTAFVLVTSPRRDAVEEALFFADRLAESHIAVQGLVVNRLYPRFDAQATESSSATALSGLADGAGMGRNGRALAALVANRDELRAMAEREETHYAALAARLAPAPAARVPLLPTDVHDLDGLAVVADHIFRAGEVATEAPAA
ncbi:MAG TPA: ArsA family ATPase [Acidimicrobiales bacterium]|jgi:anion-transporting  ArsA/GET3 family ATPase